MFILLLATGVAAAANLFPDPVFPAGGHPAAVAAADFNGDGKIDLATANSHSNDLSILLALGGGEFEPERRIAMGGRPTWLAVADFNADGKIDLAVTDFANSVSIFLGGGDGSFVLDDQYQVSGGIPFIPRFVAAADLNLDGVPDLAVASLPYDTISVLLGKGDGTFRPAAQFASGGGSAGGGSYSLAVVDFNMDGFLDLAVATLGGPYEEVVLFGHGDGQFDAPLPLVDGAGFFINAADFNRDGKPDLAASDLTVPHVSVLLGDGEGGILRRVVIDGLPQSESWLGSADFDGDGSPDLATSFGLLLGHGDGDFDPLVPSIFPPDGNAIADFDADGFPDLAAAYFDDGAAVLLNDRRGHLGALAYPTQNQTGALVKGDFTGDGIVDLAGAPYFADVIAILPGRADGTFAPEIDVPATQLVVSADDGVELSLASQAPDRRGPPIRRSIGPFVSGDFDGDGRLDLAYSKVSGSTISVLRGLGDGSFQSPVETLVGIAPATLVTGDFNGDGRTDLVALRSSSSSVQVLLGKADGSFEAMPPMSPIVPIGTTIAPTAVAVGDMDADGMQDLVVAYLTYSIAQSVMVFVGNGDGTFDLSGTYPVGHSFVSMALGDLNGDGKLDLAAAYSGYVQDPVDAMAAKTSVLLGQGGGVLGEEQSSDSVPGLFLEPIVGIADFDHDGHADLLVGGSAILLGAGDGTFGHLRQFAHAGPGVIEDFNHDGWPDIAVAYSGDVIVALNRGAGAGGSLAAHASTEASVECAGRDGAEVVLDGSASTGDITLFEWFENYQQPGVHLLGTGATLHVTLPLGTHPITLRVTDLAGASATDDITVTIVDTGAPKITVNITPNPLWPANNKMVDVSAHVRATDACGGSVDVKLASIQGDGFAPYGNGKFASNVSGAEIGTADFSFQLRAARASSKQGAYYMVTYTTTDAAGNQSSATGIVRVPHDHRDIPKSGPGPVPIP